MHVLEALRTVKESYFEPEDNGGFIPSCGFQSVAEGVVKSIGHLFAACVINGGPGPGFLSPWVYWYLVDGIGGMKDHLPEKLLKDAMYHDLFEQVC